MTKKPVIQPEDKYVIRFPDGMRDTIKRLAELNKRSMNAEIVAMLEDALWHADFELIEAGQPSLGILSKDDIDRMRELNKAAAQEREEALQKTYTLTEAEMTDLIMRTIGMTESGGMRSDTRAARLKSAEEKDQQRRTDTKPKD